jgi:hypothetical protein
MAHFVKIGTGWVNLDTVAGATVSGNGGIGLRFAGSTEFAYLDAGDSAIVREALDALAVDGHGARNGASDAAPSAAEESGDRG